MSEDKPRSKIKLEFSADILKDRDKFCEAIKQLELFEDDEPMQGLKKGILEFNLEDSYAREDFIDAINGTKYKIMLDDIWTHVFRPFYKHGYPDQEINRLTEYLGDDAYTIMEYLSKRYHEVVNEED